MRWLSYGIVCYLSLGIQLGWASFASQAGSVPNLPLLIAVFMAATAPRQGALLGCFFLGLAQDACSQHALGIYAMSYTLLALIVTGAVHLMRREHLLTHVLLSLMGGVIVVIVTWISQHLVPAQPPIELPGSGLLNPLPIGMDGIFRSLAYTALLSPVVLGILIRVAFLFDSPRRQARD